MSYYFWLFLFAWDFCFLGCLLIDSCFGVVFGRYGISNCVAIINSLFLLGLCVVGCLFCCLGLGVGFSGTIVLLLLF